MHCDWTQFIWVKEVDKIAIVQKGLTLCFDEIFTSQYIRSVYCSFKDWQMSPDKYWVLCKPHVQFSFFIICSNNMIPCPLVWFLTTQLIKSFWGYTLNVDKIRNTRLIPIFCIEGCITKILDGLVTFSNVSFQ